MRVALAQLDSTLGAVDENYERARRALLEAGDGGADLVVFPELQLSGYAVRRAGRATARPPEELAPLATEGGVPSILFGLHEQNGTDTHNSAAYFENGSLVHVQRKVYLPHYLAFEEAAAFTPGETVRAFDTALGRTAVLICNDAWQLVLPFLAVHDGACVLLLPAASATLVPEAEIYWREITRLYARLLECYVVFVNRVGTELGLTFWGGSHVVDPLGDVVAEAPRMDEALVFADIDLRRVEERRQELPLVREPRFDVLRAELERLASHAPAITTA
jgi:predicted amidohydrolase